MSLAADTREAVRERPFLLDAIRAGLVNYSAAAAWLVDDAGLSGDPQAVATALRRFADDLDDWAVKSRQASVSMRSGVGVVEDPEVEDGDDPLLLVGGAAVVPEGRETAILATGAVNARALAAVIRRLTTADVSVAAAGVAGESLVVVVPRREGATAVRVVESALERVPET